MSIATDAMHKWHRLHPPPSNCIKCGADNWRYTKRGRLCRPCANRRRNTWRKRMGKNHGPFKAAEHRRFLYGLSSDDYQNLLESQGGRCAACARKQKLVVDHDHKTKVVRGLLCSPCNLAIGMLADSPIRARQIADYLEQRLAVEKAAR